MACANLAGLFSVVIPVYNEEANIEEICKRIAVAFSGLPLPYEVLFVDDGSQDETYPAIQRARQVDNRIKAVKLQKNYGQLYAFLAGFEFAKGDIIVTMDGDLQNNPEDIPLFVEKMREGFDLVSGWRYNRRDGIARKWVSCFANWLIGMRTGVRLHDYGCALTAVRSEAVDRLRGYGRNSRFIKPLLAKLSHSSTEIKVTHHPRRSGKSKYSLFRILRMGLDFIFFFNNKPRAQRMPYTIEELLGI